MIALTLSSIAAHAGAKYSVEEKPYSISGGLITNEKIKFCQMTFDGKEAKQISSKIGIGSFPINFQLTKNDKKYTKHLMKNPNNDPYTGNVFDFYISEGFKIECKSSELCTISIVSYCPDNIDNIDRKNEESGPEAGYQTFDNSPIDSLPTQITNLFKNMQVPVKTNTFQDDGKTHSEQWKDINLFHGNIKVQCSMIDRQPMGCHLSFPWAIAK